MGLKRPGREHGARVHGEHSDDLLYVYTADFAQNNTICRRPVLSLRFPTEQNRRCMMGKTLVKWESRN